MELIVSTLISERRIDVWACSSWELKQNNESVVCFRRIFWFVTYWSLRKQVKTYWNLVRNKQVFAFFVLPGVSIVPRRRSSYFCEHTFSTCFVLFTNPTTWNLTVSLINFVIGQNKVCCLLFKQGSIVASRLLSLIFEIYVCISPFRSFF